MPSIETLKAFAEERPDDPFPVYALAMEHKRQGALEEADRVFRDLRRRHPDYLPQYLIHGQVLEGMGGGDAAAEAYRLGLEVARRTGEAHAEEELQEALDAL